MKHARRSVSSRKNAHDEPISTGESTRQFAQRARRYDATPQTKDWHAHPEPAVRINLPRRSDQPWRPSDTDQSFDRRSVTLGPRPRRAVRRDRRRVTQGRRSRPWTAACDLAVLHPWAVSHSPPAAREAVRRRPGRGRRQQLGHRCGEQGRCDRDLAGCRGAYCGDDVADRLLFVTNPRRRRGGTRRASDPQRVRSAPPHRRWRRGGDRRDHLDRRGAVEVVVEQHDIRLVPGGGCDTGVGGDRDVDDVDVGVGGSTAWSDSRGTWWSSMTRTRIAAAPVTTPPGAGTSPWCRAPPAVGSPCRHRARRCAHASAPARSACDRRRGRTVRRRHRRSRARAARRRGSARS